MNMHFYRSEASFRNIPVRSVLLILLISMLFIPAAHAQDTTPASIIQAQQATVFLMQTYDINGVQAISCVGSGTLISASGLILTNAHLAQPLGPCRGEQIVVALPVRLDEPPVPTYLAELAQLDIAHDLAVLQIKGSLDGSLIEPETLNLPFATIGDPAQLSSGASINLIGFADIGATPVSVEQRLLTSAITETSGSRLAWFRLDANAGGGMSGGGAFDQEGRLLGIPTSAPATTGLEPGLSCLSIQDTNNDSFIDSRDACVPIGAPVKAIRPINFAIPLIEATQIGLTLEHMPGIPEAQILGTPTFSRLFFSSQIDEHGVPTEIVTSLPSGVSSLFLFFDYQGMRPGLPYELEVAKDGASMPQMSVGPLPWSGGNRGQWYIGTENIIWLDGTYEFTLLLNNSPIASARISIGGAGDAQRFSNLSFSAFRSDGRLSGNGTLLPAESTEIRATFDYSGMPEGQPWKEIWYLDGTEISNITRLWEAGPSGITSVSASNLDGLPLGTYRLELFLGDQLAAAGDVTLAGNPNPANGESMVFTNARIFSDITRDGLPAGQPGPVLPLGINTIYTFINWDFMPNNAEWTYRWFLDGRLVASSANYWNAGGVGEDFWIKLSSIDGLPEGEYALEVLVEQRPMFSASASIGAGTQPISGQQTESDEVMISGQVLDALTGEGIAGALVFILEVQYESPQFEWDESQILTQAITDREGRFSLPRGLPRRNFYTTYVFADGYITIVEDFFIVSSEQPTPSEITIEMARP